MFREIPPKNFLFKAIYRFEKMEPYAAIVDEDKPNALMFWKKNERKKYECINAAGRKFDLFLDDVPVLVHMSDGHTSEVFKDNKNYALMGKDKNACVEIVEALVIEGKQDYVFYGNNIHLYSVLDNYNKIKEALVRKKNEKTEKPEESEKNEKKPLFSLLTGVFKKGDDSEEKEPEIEDEGNLIGDTDALNTEPTVAPTYTSVPIKSDYSFNNSGVKEYSTKLSEKGIAVLAFGALFLLGLIGYVGSMIGHRGKIQVPDSARKLCGEQYEKVVGMFETKGFTNITTKKDEDLVTGWINSEGEVEDVVINGDSSFGADSWYTADAKIVIVYHAFPSKEIAEEATEDTDKNTMTTETTEKPTTEGTTTEATTTEATTTEATTTEATTTEATTTEATTTEATTTEATTTEATTTEAKIVYDFILNNNNGVFHVANCRYVSRMKNKSYISATYDDMINRGYDPCDYCALGLH